VKNEPTTSFKQLSAAQTPGSCSVNKVLNARHYLSTNYNPNSSSIPPLYNLIIVFTIWIVHFFRAQFTMDFWAEHNECVFALTNKLNMEKFDTCQIWLLPRQPVCVCIECVVFFCHERIRRNCKFV